MNSRIFAASALLASLAAPVTAAPQFTDAAPTGWAYSALQNLSERYGCAVGYPDGTYRGNNFTTRYETTALMSACLDRIYDSMTQADRDIVDKARIANAVANARISALETVAARKATEVGSYVGVGLNLNRQGVDSNNYSYNRTVAGVAIQSRFPLASVYGATLSARPYANFAAGPDSEIGAAAGVFGTLDFSLAGRQVGGTYVSSTNFYLGAGGQWALTNDGQANFQTSIGQGSQVMIVAGLERSFTRSLVGFADIKFPTQESGVSGTAYAPAGTVGLGFKF